MKTDRDISFRLCFVSEPRESPAPGAAAILERVRMSADWDEASIVPVQGQFPRMHVSRCEGRGFVVHCFEDEESWGDFLAVVSELSRPSIEINLAGQALERWPAELFVSEQLAVEAVDYFLGCGKRNPAQSWVASGAFQRETVWVGRVQREAWERSRRSDV